MTAHRRIEYNLSTAHQRQHVPAEYSGSSQGISMETTHVNASPRAVMTQTSVSTIVAISALISASALPSVSTTTISLTLGWRHPLGMRTISRRAPTAGGLASMALSPATQIPTRTSFGIVREAQHMNCLNSLAVRRGPPMMMLCVDFVTH